MNDRWCIVFCIHAVDRIANDGFSQISVHVSLTDAFIDGIRQISPFNMYFLADFDENDGHPRILADRDHVSPGNLQILLKLV